MQIWELRRPNGTVVARAAGFVPPLYSGHRDDYRIVGAVEVWCDGTRMMSRDEDGRWTPPLDMARDVPFSSAAS